MKRDDLNDLAAFVMVAEERSFTRAAARLGLSQSALSHAMKQLEGRIGVPLLRRTTRSVATTEAGEQLLAGLRPALQQISSDIAAIKATSGKPSGTIRIVAGRYPAACLILPILDGFLLDNPDITVELIVEERFTDIVSERFDAGIRLGERVEKDMISVRLSPDIRSVVVASPDYLRKKGRPRHPRDLIHHDCITYRQMTAGGHFLWEFEKAGDKLSMRVGGRLTLNDLDMMVDSALAGLGFAYVFEDQVRQHVEQGRLIHVLDDWCPAYPGFFLYYPHRRQTASALAAFVAAARYRAGARRTRYTGRKPA